MSTIIGRGQTLVMKRIIIVCGPTGIGKTSFSISIARRFNGEIVGADSMQVYKYMNIGTAKPEPHEVAAAPHHLIDFVDPKQEFDAGRFVREADRAIAKITAEEKIPIVAGGTGLYIKALLHGLFRSGPVCEKKIRELNRLLEEKGASYLHRELACHDPKAALKIHENDTFRVIRALEVFLTTGKRISDRQTDHHFNENRYQYLKIGLKTDREMLYNRINRRVEIMLKHGLLLEVKGLINKGYSFDLKPMQSIGYKHMGMFIRGEVDWEEAVRLLKRDTRRYAKRQLTWFNRDREIHWVEPGQIKEAETLVKEFLT